MHYSAPRSTACPVLLAPNSSPKRNHTTFSASSLKKRVPWNNVNVHFSELQAKLDNFDLLLKKRRAMSLSISCKTENMKFLLFCTVYKDGITTDNTRTTIMLIFGE
jgi:hypothetical protein